MHLGPDNFSVHFQMGRCDKSAADFSFLKQLRQKEKKISTDGGKNMNLRRSNFFIIKAWRQDSAKKKKKAFQLVSLGLT